MKVLNWRIELVRVDSAMAEFLVRLELEGDAERVRGTAVGPRCAGVSTVEVAYPLVLVEKDQTSATLRGVIPEPNLWAPEQPFVYVVSVEVAGGGGSDERRANLGLKQGGLIR